MKLLSRINNMLVKFSEWLMVVFLNIMFLGVALQMILRYFNNSLLQIEDLVKISFSWLIFAGIGVLFKNDEHIAVTALMDALPEKIGQKLYILQRVITFCFLVGLLIFGIQFAMTGLYSLLSQLLIQYFWVYISVPMAALFGILFYIEYFWGLSKKNPTN